ncbi:MAG: carbohydrate kinase family protein [Candidatus Dormibacteraceae bacterium]
MSGGHDAGVVVAGHLCLDVICSAPPAGDLSLRPGTLTVVGPATLASGGCVANTGGALRRLGVPARLVGKLGADAFGDLLARRLAGLGEGAVRHLIRAPQEATSYSVIMNPDRGDRSILHFPGCNATFRSSDVPDSALAGAAILHFGYPPLMRAIYEGGGGELERLLLRARAAGLITSLDLAYPDPFGEGADVDWGMLLNRVLRCAQIFLPSLDELQLMLGTMDRGPASAVALGRWAVAQGAAIAALKCGDRGLHLRTGSRDRLREVAAVLPIDLSQWSDRELWSAAFDVEVAGTTGAGDAATAGFLLALLRGFRPEEAANAACAVAASSVERPDGTGGVTLWESIEGRIRAGWGRLPVDLPPDWVRADGGVWSGPSDGSSSKEEAHR